MPPAKPKPSEIAAEAKKNYIPFIRNKYWDTWPTESYLCQTDYMVAKRPSVDLKPRFAFYEKDPVDMVLGWMSPDDKDKIAVVMPANEKKPGGDWEAGVMSPEECLCRRSNLAATLSTPAAGNAMPSNYPIPLRAGIYSSRVVVFRDGPDKYNAWDQYKALPVISVCPVRRPKLDPAGKKYSFQQEKELMKDKIRTVLRIAVYYKHTRLCIGTFGLGTGFKNPPDEVALMWRDLILNDPEFIGQFQDIVFAFEAPERLALAPSSSKATSAKTSSKSSTSKASSATIYNAAADLEVFKYYFTPAVIHSASKSVGSSSASGSRS